jgi:hypothetical protein
MHPPYRGNFLLSLAAFMDVNRGNYRDRMQRVRPLCIFRERDSSRDSAAKNRVEGMAEI